MVESKDNVKVAIRIRPLNDREISEGSKKCISVQEPCKTICIGDHKSFTYDYVADEEVNQEKIFEMVGKPIASSCMSGYNGTIFAYGQTGAGKTFTIQGSVIEELTSDSSIYHHRGILPRCFEYIFSVISASLKSGNVEFLVKCSYLEIYQEQIHDLLDPNPQNLLLREDMKKGAYVDGIIEEQVTNLMETYQILKIGSRNRHVSSTSMNKESSRSHSVFSMNIESKSNFDGLVNFKSSRFNLIDLAGSERQKSTATIGDRLKEAGMINKSLSALGNVINSLVELSEGKSRHVPYRDSKLTFLLKDSLGGNSKTFIIANISPAVSSFSETLSTLKFAQRAKLIKNSAVINEDTSGTVLLLKNEVKRLKEELESVKDIAKLAVAQCPKCAGINQIEIPNLLKTFNKNTEAEVLLESNLRLRLESERKFQKSIQDKESLIDSLKHTVSRLDNKINHDKMILKFRNATIAKLQNGEEDKDVLALKKENEILREELEDNPNTSKLYVENKILSEEIAEMKLEFEAGYGSLKQKNIELQEFTEQLCENITKSNAERQKLNAICTEMAGGKDIELILTDIEEKYLDDMMKLKEIIRELTKENTQLQAENKLIHESYENGENSLDKPDDIITSPRSSLKSDEESKRLQEKLEKREKEIEELKLKLATELQSKDTLFIEKRSMEKTINDLIKENSSLKSLEEQYNIIQSELEFTKLRYEEKYTEYVLVTQEIDNLTESTEYLKSEISKLNFDISHKRARISELEHTGNLLEKQNTEQAAMIIALQDPTGNKTLALALSECEHYKQRALDLEQELSGCKKAVQDLGQQMLALTKQNEETSLDLSASKATLIELKDMLAVNKKTISDLKDTEQNLLDEVEGLKEIAQREKHHGDILRERMMNKHNEVINKLNAEKTELVKEIDVLKGNYNKALFEINDIRARETLAAEKLASEQRASQRSTDELIEIRVLLEKTKKELAEEKDNKSEVQALMQAKVNDCMRQEINLKELYKDLKTKCDSYEDSIKNLNNDNQKYLKLLETAKQDYNRLESEMSQKIENSFMVNKNQKNTLDAEISNLNESLKVQKDLNQKIIKDLQDSQEKIGNIDEALKKKAKEKENLEISYKDISERLKESELKLFNALKESEKEISKIKNLQIDLDASKIAQEELLKKLNASLAKYSELEKRLTSEKVKYEDLVKIYDELKNEKAEVFNQLQTLLSELSEEKSKNFEASKKITAIQTKKQELESERENYKIQLLELQSTKSNLDKNTTQLEIFLSQEQKTNNFLTKTLEDTKDHLMNIENLLASEKTQAESLRIKLAQTESDKSFIESLYDQEKAKNACFERTAEDLKYSLAESQEKASKLEQALSLTTQSKEKLDIDFKECLSKNSELFSIIEEKNNKNKEQELMNINLLNEKEQSNILTESQKNQIKTLNTELNDAKLQLEENKNLINALKNKNNEYSSKIKENAQIFEEIEKDKDCIVDLEKQRQARDLEIFQLKKIIEGLNAVIESKVKMHDEVQFQITVLKQDLEAANRNKERLESEIDRKEIDFINIQQGKANLEKDLETNKKILYEKDQIAQQYADKLIDYQNKIEKGDLDLKKATENIKSLEYNTSELEEQILDLKSSNKSLTTELEALKVKHASSKSKKSLQIQSLNSKISEYEKLKQDSDRLSSDVSEKTSEIETLISEKKELINQISELHSSQEILRNELDLSLKELKSLKEDLKQKAEAIKASSININYTREEITTWKKCIEEKNFTIQELKTELKSLKQDVERNQNEKYHEKQTEYLTKLLEVKESELIELKSKAMVLMEKDNSIEIQKKDLEIVNKKQEAAQSELKTVKNELTSSLEVRESLMNSLKSFRDDDIRNKKEINDNKKLIKQLKDDNLKFIKEISKLNEENIRLSEGNSPQYNFNDKNIYKIKKLEENIASLEGQIKLKNIEIEKYNKRLGEIRKKNPEENVLRKEIEKQAEEINNLTDGLAKITDFVFSLPAVSTDPEETSIIESTIKAIKIMYLDLQSKERALNERKNKRADTISQSISSFRNQLAPHYPILSSPSEKSLRIQSPKNKVYK